VRSAALAVLVIGALALPATPALAFWTAGGSGSGSGLVATMPTGNQPSGSVAGQTVTVAFAQNSFASSPLGTYTGGGYSVKRYAQGSSTALTPNASCATTISGSAATLQCAEASVPYGAWQYSITPVLNTFTGGESTKSAVVTVAPGAPTLSSVTAQNPASGQSTGAIALSWSAVSGATGYNVYRRTSTGSYDFNSPLNGATPVTGTSYSDPGAGLTGGTTYDYVVRATAGSPAVESASSNELGATAIARPSAPAGAVTATALAGAQIGVSWSSVSGVVGYNVYRRTSAGSYDFNSPLNGSTPFSGTSYTDTTTVNGTTYFYVIRSVITGAGSAQVESFNSSESNGATADNVAPPAPTSVTVGSGGSVLGSATCGFASGTRFINNAGKGSVSVTANIAAPESGENVVLSATTPGSTAVTKTVAAGSTSVVTTMDLSTLLDGVVTLTARTQDAAGNQSATTGPTNAIRKDTVSSLSGLVYTDNLLGFADTVAGTSECGSVITATEVTGPNPGKTFPVSDTFTVGSGGSFSGFAVDAIFGVVLGVPYSYNFFAADLAGNSSGAVNISGFDHL
jgi:hypothetical protein